MKNKILKAIKRKFDLSQYKIDAQISSDYIVILSGEVDDWQQVVDIGHITAKVKGVNNVVNNITVKGIIVEKKDNTKKIEEVLKKGNIKNCDVVIIGAGISGCAIARELSKYDLKIIVVEKNSDIAEEATKANNGNIHPGLLVQPGTLKAKLNLRGNELYTKWAEELNFELKRPGSLYVVYEKREWRKILLVKYLKKSGLCKHIKLLAQLDKTPGLKWMSGEEVRALEPNVKGRPVGGFMMYTMGIVEPYQVAIALAENAVDNGAEFILEAEVLDVIIEASKAKGVITDKGIIRSKYVINCAGIYADDIAEMAKDKFFTIHGRKGAIAIIDKNRRGFFNIPLGGSTKRDKSSEYSKGGGASVTPEGNLLWGPSALEIQNKEDKSVEAKEMEFIVNLGRSITDEVKPNEIITFFSGIRPADYMEDFIIGMSKKTAGFINVAAIQSPGLASAPAIAEMVEGIIKEDMNTLKLKKDYNPIRKGKVNFRRLSHEEQDVLIKQNPKYANIICRCEVITEGEILDAIHSNIPVTTVDAVKRRTRGGMGRCQGGFCGPRVLEILAREMGKDATEITLKGHDSYILESKNRE